MNVSFEYLYRDASNYKNWGEVVLETTSGLDVAELERQIQRALIDGQNFVAEDVGVPTLYFAARDETIDHGWHEYAGLSWTDDTATQQGSIEQFISRLQLSQSKQVLIEASTLLSE